mgnify:FL=1
MFTHTPTRTNNTTGDPCGAAGDNSILNNPQQQPEFQQIVTNTSSQNVREIGASAVHKLPPFWTHNPKLWFIQIEAVFALAGRTRDETKFQYVVANLDPQISEYVSHIIFNPPPNITQYAAIKEALLGAFGESDELRIRKLLSGQPLDDNKPTQFLKKIKNLASGHIDDTVLKSIFLEQMPDQIRTILAVTDSPLQVLAEQADTILEFLKPTSICAFSPVESVLTTSTHSTNHISISEVTLQQLSNQIRTLENKIENLKVNRGRSLSRESSSSRSRRSVSRNCEWCWYHNRFGENASKCTSPCSYLKN